MNKLQQNLNEFKLNTKIVVAVIVTLALFLTSGFLMSLCFIAEGFSAIGMLDGGSSGGASGGGGGGGISLGGGNSTVNKPPITSNSQPGAKTGIVLPCATPAGNYLSSPDENTKNISSDTEIKSGAAVLVDTTGNVVVASKNADTKIYPASMTKVMTLLVACENAKDPNALLTVTQDMIDYKIQTGGSGGIQFEAGDQIAVEHALHLIIYDSDTIACLLIANYVSENEAEFVKLMNKKASSLGLSKTNFVTCTGLHDNNHYTTAREMAAIMSCAMNNATAKKIMTAWQGYGFEINKADGSAKSALAWSDWYSGRLKDNNNVGGGGKIVAGKTGWETIPVYCFVTAAEKNGEIYVCVTVGRLSEDQPKISEANSTSDHKYIYKNYAE